MILSEKISQVSSDPGVAFWAANISSNGICDLTRISGIRVNEDKEHVTFFVPKQSFDLISDNFNERPSVSLLMASLRNFESYQIKGEYISHKICTEEEIAYYQPKVTGLIDLCNSMGLNGNKIFDSYIEEPNVAVKVLCKETFEQTPKPGTGNKLDS